jgi:hypothetical protein
MQLKRWVFSRAILQYSIRLIRKCCSIFWMVVPVNNYSIDRAKTKMWNKHTY